MAVGYSSGQRILYGYVAHIVISSRGLHSASIDWTSSVIHLWVLVQIRKMQALWTQLSIGIRQRLHSNPNLQCAAHRQVTLSRADLEIMMFPD